MILFLATLACLFLALTAGLPFGAIGVALIAALWIAQPSPRDEGEPTIGTDL
jgi:hypothetical protein